MFHDAPVGRVLLQDGALCIETDAFSPAPNETLPPARIVIAAIRDVYRDDVKVAAFLIESDDAEIYGLEIRSDGVRLNLAWCFWHPRAPDIFRAYCFPGATLHVEALSGGPLVPLRTRPPSG